MQETQIIWNFQNFIILQVHEITLATVADVLKFLLGNPSCFSALVLYAQLTEPCNSSCPLFLYQCVRLYIPFLLVIYKR